MPTVPVYNSEGKQVGEQTLSDAVFGVPLKDHVVSAVVESLQANARRAVAHTKHRGEVRGGGKKPWKQKGTGRARAGSIRSPLWRGGGVIFGPRSDRNFSKKVNARLRRDAIRMCLSDKVRDHRFCVVDQFSAITPQKTKAAHAVFRTLGRATGCAFGRTPTMLLVGREDTLARITRNLATVHPTRVEQINALTLTAHPYLIASREAVLDLESRFQKAM